MAIIGYARVSTDAQGKDDKSSIEDQFRRIRAIATLRGEEMDFSFSDIGVSGSVPLAERPNGSMALNAAQPGDIIVASKLDRLFRSASDALATVEELKKRGVGVVFADIGPDAVTESGVSKLFFTMLAAFAEFERERIAERISDGKAAKKAKGGFMGGLPPYGMRVVDTPQGRMLAISEGEATVVGTMKAMAGDDEPSATKICEITDWLNDKGFKTRSGRPWHQTQVRRILERV
jgi:DNA invertase Pin-like site-specific DNA recombinase